MIVKLENINTLSHFKERVEDMRHIGKINYFIFYGLMAKLYARFKDIYRRLKGNKNCYSPEKVYLTKNSLLIKKYIEDRDESLLLALNLDKKKYVLLMQLLRTIPAEVLTISEESILLPINIKKIFCHTIYYDVTWFYNSKKITGIQRVTQNILNNLEACLPNDYDLCPVIYDGNSGSLIAVEQTICRSNGVSTWQLLGPVDICSNDIFLSVDLNISISELLPKLKKMDVKSYVILYDLVFILYPEFAGSKDAVKHFIIWLVSATKYADGILAISESVLREYVNWGTSQGYSLPKTDFFHLGSDEVTVPIEEPNLPLKIDFNLPTFISISTIEPRKGFVTLVKAFQKVINSDLRANLIIVGRRGWKNDEIIKYLKTESVFWLENCNDDELRFLLKSSNFFVFASEYEGFGLPIVEASRFGLPLILRNLSVFKEIAGNNALYFKNETELSLIMRGLLTGEIKAPTNHTVTHDWKQATNTLISKILLMND